MAGAFILAPAVARANVEERGILSSYARAVAAGNAGMSAKSAADFETLLSLSSGSEVVARRALSEAIAAGNWMVAIRAARIVREKDKNAADAHLLLLAEALRKKDWERARHLVDVVGRNELLAFTVPVIEAWISFGSGKGKPLDKLDGLSGDPLRLAYAMEHRPLLLLASGKEREALAELAPILAEQSGRSLRLRFAAASFLAKQGRRDVALALLTEDDGAMAAARRLLNKGRQIPGTIDSPATGVAELFTRIAVDLSEQQVEPLALIFSRIATYLAPENSITWLVTSELLDKMERQTAAVEALGQIASADPFAMAAYDARIGLLLRSGQADRALSEATDKIRSGAASQSDWSRLGDVYMYIGRHDKAAEAYQLAIDRAATSPDKALWTLWLLHGSALDQAGKWSEAKISLEKAHALAPRQPLVLNYLGYAQLQRRENIESAMRLIAEASALQPDSAEITDSLGWAHYLQGNLSKAVELLERAVEKAPSDPEIYEHLGDAYFSAGRRFEARYAWNAALLYAAAETADRLRRKIEKGLTPELASR